ncbi:hypothetical protein [Nocardia veterana]|uniref:Uncharacterized protein n=1 Tax=Nocardia veterana TaxID=132249 RepID=A0A7X6LXY5_9NOCA|nr:hypothetical protein [Nocardia veterana]NKY85812.1 hypothetical protein [Nocardia veterana]
MRFSPTDEVLVSLPAVCALAQTDLAHDVMQYHRSCRAEQCAWKQVAYRTLVHFRRIEPPRLSRRQRAQRRDIEFPYPSSPYVTAARTDIPIEIYQQVLDGLNELANSLSANNSRDR